MARGFLDSLDIANRALQHVGAPPILTIDEDSRANSEVSFVYDKLRRAELRRNLWVFATRWALLRPLTVTSFLLNPEEWSELTTYRAGALVRTDNGDIWSSLVPENLGNEPGSTTAWEQYFGPLSVDEYDADTTYGPGDLVYAQSGNPGGFAIFLSLAEDNDEDPETGTAWDADTRYGLDDVVRYSGAQYRSLIPYNLGITPANGPADWDADVTYSAAQTVTGSDGFIYSAVGSTTGDDPVTDNGTNWTNTGVANAWSSVPTEFQSSQNWLPLYAGLKKIVLTSPNASLSSGGRRYYRLPAGHLRKAPQNPRFSDAKSDWQVEGDYFTTSDSGPIAYRFIADITDVTKFDDMFCEGLACRIALEVCEPLTQSTTKFQNIGAAYKTFMSEARTIDAIEAGPTEPEQDDFITVRA